MRRADLFHGATAAFALAALLAPVSARACTITTTAVAFGAYNPQSASNDDGTGSIDLACATSVTAPVVAINAGTYGTFAPRQMGSGANRLNYNLYSDAARTTVWGDGTSGTSSVTLGSPILSGGQHLFSRTVYGRTTALQNVPAGTYADTLIVTVTF